MKKSVSQWKDRGIRLKDSTNLHKKSLSDLIDCQSVEAIKCLGLDLDFMHNLQPRLWRNSNDYKIAKSFVNKINVVNDPAERSMALIASYNDTLSREEDVKQNILQVVEDNRKRIKYCNKKTLLTSQIR